MGRESAVMVRRALRGVKTGILTRHHRKSTALPAYARLAEIYPNFRERKLRMKKVVSEISGVVFSLPWLVAKDNGLFEAEGIDMEFVKAIRTGPVEHTENPENVNPILGHVAFEQGQVSIYRA